MVWHRGTGQASYNLTVKDGQANLQLSFQLGKPNDHHLPLPSQRKRTKAKGEKQKERDCERAAAHHAKLAAASAVSATEDEVISLETGKPVLTEPPPPPPASGEGGTARRPSTRSTTVLVKMKMAAFARSAAEISLKETLPQFLPGFSKDIDSNMFVFGFFIEKELVTKELLERMKLQWKTKDKYWNHRPAEVFDISV